MRTASFTSKLTALLLAAMVATAACGSDTTEPTPIVPIAQSVDVYSGPLEPGGTNTYLFTLTTTVTVQMMLAGALLENPLRSISPTLRLTFATWNGTECVTTQTVDTEPRLTAALHAYLGPGTHCAMVSDPGNLTEPAGVTIRIVAPALIDTGGDPGAAVFASSITPQGTATRSFEASVAGQVAITLAELSGGAPVGLGLGIRATDGTGCKLAQIVRVGPGSAPQITTRVDPGDFCVSLWDVGNITQTETFSLRIVHP